MSSCTRGNGADPSLASNVLNIGNGRTILAVSKGRAAAAGMDIFRWVDTFELIRDLVGNWTSFQRRRARRHDRPASEPFRSSCFVISAGLRVPRIGGSGCLTALSVGVPDRECGVAAALGSRATGGHWVFGGAATLVVVPVVFGGTAYGGWGFRSNFWSTNLQAAAPSFIVELVASAVSTTFDCWRRGDKGRANSCSESKECRPHSERR